MIWGEVNVLGDELSHLEHAAGGHNILLPSGFPDAVKILKVKTIRAAAPRKTAVFGLSGNYPRA